MSTRCCCTPAHTSENAPDKRYRLILWIALVINFAMFMVEVVAGVLAGSVSLQADALDFLADAGNYAISLFVLGMALRRRAQAALFKGFTLENIV